MIGITARRIPRQSRAVYQNLRRSLSTLENNKNIYVFKDPKSPSSNILSFLPTEPPTTSLAIGTTSQVPPNPTSVIENPKFLNILHSVIAEQASQDPMVQSQAAAMASSSGASLFQPHHRQQTGSAGASDQGGYGSAGRGGWVHVSDLRHPPDFGRIAEPEDIFGSVEVDGNGQFVDGHGRYQVSGTYRVCTNDGILELSDHLRSKLIERLRIEETAERNQK